MEPQRTQRAQRTSATTARTNHSEPQNIEHRFTNIEVTATAGAHSSRLDIRHSIFCGSPCRCLRIHTPPVMVESGSSGVNRAHRLQDSDDCHGLRGHGCNTAPGYQRRPRLVLAWRSIRPHQIPADPSRWEDAEIPGADLVRPMASLRVARYVVHGAAAYMTYRHPNQETASRRISNKELRTPKCRQAVCPQTSTFGVPCWIFCGSPCLCRSPRTKAPLPHGRGSDRPGFPCCCL